MRRQLSRAAAVAAAAACAAAWIAATLGAGAPAPAGEPRGASAGQGSAVAPAAAQAPVSGSYGEKGATGDTVAAKRPIELFDGRSVAGWTPFLPGGDPSATWTVADGVLRCTGKPAGYIATDRTFTSFILDLEWRFDAAKGAGNSGVLLRVQPPDAVWPTSMEAQLMSGHAGDIWNIGEFPMVTDPARTSGRHTAMEGASAERPLGEWNRYRIVVDGPLLELYVNGELKNRATGCRVVPGRIALQSEGAWIEFRGIRLTELPDGAPSPQGTHAPAPAAKAAPPKAGAADGKAP